VNYIMNRTIITVALLSVGSAVSAMDQGGGSQISNQGQQSQQVQGLEKLSRLPQQAQQALQKEARMHDARISDVDERSKNGTQYYVVELENQDQSWNVKVSQEGTIVEIQKDRLAWEKVPQTVQQALLREAKSGEMITEVEKTRRNGQIAYKAELEKDGKGHDVCLDANGQKLPEQSESSMQQGSQSQQRQ
jgi:uncharacterized membrane protein YkoI